MMCFSPITKWSQQAYNRVFVCVRVCLNMCLFAFISAASVFFFIFLVRFHRTQHRKFPGLQTVLQFVSESSLVTQGGKEQMLGIPSLGWWKVDTNISFYILTDLEFESSCCQNCFLLWLGCGWAGGVRSGTPKRKPITGCQTSCQTDMTHSTNTDFSQLPFSTPHMHIQTCTNAHTDTKTDVQCLREWKNGMKTLDVKLSIILLSSLL